MTSGDVLRVENARKSYGGTPALQGAAMSLRAGEWLALLGPNGAGKTTLIRAIAGRVRLDDGTITLLGHNLTGFNGGAQHVRAKLGIVPQDLALYPLLTARENLYAFGELYGVDRASLRDRVAWSLSWTGLADRANSLVKTFSGGMKRRLNIACSVLHQPQVVLLDEPTVGVDPQSRERIWHMLSELRQQGTSLLLTTHQLDEAQHICDRIIIIDHGRTIAHGTLDELIHQTIGAQRHVTITLDRTIPPSALGDTVECADAVARCMMNDVATELPALLERAKAAGCNVIDVQVQPPSLHAVFIHLTGRDLRE